MQILQVLLVQFSYSCLSLTHINTHKDSQTSVFLSAVSIFLFTSPHPLFFIFPFHSALCYSNRRSHIHRFGEDVCLWVCVYVFFVFFFLFWKLGGRKSQAGREYQIVPVLLSLNVCNLTEARRNCALSVRYVCELCRKIGCGETKAHCVCPHAAQTHLQWYNTHTPTVLHCTPQAGVPVLLRAKKNNTLNIKTLKKSSNPLEKYLNINTESKQMM